MKTIIKDENHDRSIKLAKENAPLLVFLIIVICVKIYGLKLMIQ